LPGKLNTQLARPSGGPEDMRIDSAARRSTTGLSQTWKFLQVLAARLWQFEKENNSMLVAL
jgi:hypothetical protein